MTNKSEAIEHQLVVLQSKPICLYICLIIWICKVADLGKAFLFSFALKLPFNPKLTFLFYLSSHLAFGSHFDFSALTLWGHQLVVLWEFYWCIRSLYGGNFQDSKFWTWRNLLFPFVWFWCAAAARALSGYCFDGNLFVVFCYNCSICALHFHWWVS